MYAAEELRKENQELKESTQLYKQLSKEEKNKVEGIMLGLKLAREHKSAQVEEMSKKSSVLTDDMEHCFVCGSPYAECHHVFFGSYQKKYADKYKFYLPLCPEHHKGNSGPHMNKTKDIEYKKMAQRYYEKNISDRSDFMMDFGKNYLWDEEVQPVQA